MKNKLFIILGLLLSPAILAGGLQASFEGSSYPETLHSTVLEYHGDVDGSGNWIDLSGSNYEYCSEDFTTNWIPSHVTVGSNQYKNPIDNTLTADVLHEDTGNFGRYVLIRSPLPAGYYVLSVYIRPLARSWIALYDLEGGFAYLTNFNIATCTLGTSYPTFIDAGCQRIDTNWVRIWQVGYRATPVTTSHYIYVEATASDGGAYIGLDQDAVVIYGADVRSIPTGSPDHSPGVYHPTTFIVKPRLDLTQNGNPPTGFSDLQDASGNRLSSRSFDGATQYYTRATSGVYDIFTGDHTLTFVAKRLTGASYPAILEIGGYTRSGLLIQYGGSTMDAYYSKDGSSKTVTGPAFSTDTWHIGQVVCSNNLAKVCIDGSCGSAVDITGYGIYNPSKTPVYFGSDYGALNKWKGEIAFIQADKRALSANELAQQRERLWGIFSNRSAW